MRTQANYKAIVISALLTALVLATAAGGLLAANKLSANPADASSDPLAAQPSPIVLTGTSFGTGTQPTSAALQPTAANPAASDAVIAAYQTQLQQAYVALEEAYAQIDALQASQNQSLSSHEEEREHERDGHDDHDDHDEDNLAFREHEADDDD